MTINNKNLKIILFLVLSTFSISINNFYGNIGVFPMDTLAFFDTAYSILLNKHPFKDIWIFSGPFVDYIQAVFFKIFGLSWFSYVLHASVFNLIITTTVFFALNKNGLNIYLSFLYALSVATLCYPVAGTPFAYQHAFVLSLISIFIFTLAIKTKFNLYWFLLPILMVSAFLSMQTPSVYINLLIFFFSIFYFVKRGNKKNFIYFIIGSLSILLLLILYFVIVKIPIKSFIVQYFLFPMTIGGNRIIGDDQAFISLAGKITFRGLVGHFKFINFFFIFLIAVTFLKYFKKTKLLLTKDEILVNLLLILSTVAYIFHQLITANQTFIFSLIPILAGFVHIYLKKYYPKKIIIQAIVLLVVIFASVKYHSVYNNQRKFMDLQHADLTKALDASLIDKKLKNLKWISPSYIKNPEEEINLLKTTIEILKNEKRNKMVITHYQFFSSILEEDLNIPNRWYLHDNNNYPIENHKHYRFYKDLFNKNFKSNEIEVIYIVKSFPEEGIYIGNFEIYLDNVCFKNKEINKILSIHEVENCK
ncbi:hypothetical protein OAJ18_00945 [Pelagibacteraceae bacterium]|nr:hypothetical protein [Pelagibacteraceae bacterium]